MPCPGQGVNLCRSSFPTYLDRMIDDYEFGRSWTLALMVFLDLLMIMGVLYLVYIYVRRTVVTKSGHFSSCASMLQYTLILYTLLADLMGRRINLTSTVHWTGIPFGPCRYHCDYRCLIICSAIYSVHMYVLLYGVLYGVLRTNNLHTVLRTVQSQLFVIIVTLQPDNWLCWYLYGVPPYSVYTCMYNTRCRSVLAIHLYSNALKVEDCTTPYKSYVRSTVVVYVYILQSIVWSAEY